VTFSQGVGKTPRKDSEEEGLRMQSELIRFEQVELNVQDIARSLKLWCDVVGLHELEVNGEVAVLGIDRESMIVLGKSATKTRSTRVRRLISPRTSSAERA
jgi:catechol-2,3-dioxygenase